MPAEWRLEDTDKRRLRHGGSMITTEKITTTDVKRFNKNRIFRLIHYADKISRQEIADILGHQDVDSTAVYLKSSLSLLRECTLNPQEF